MKITIARRGEELSVYMAKKDLEEHIVAIERLELWGGWIELANGWRLALPEVAGAIRMPVTVNARRLDATRLAERLQEDAEDGDVMPANASKRGT